MIFAPLSETNHNWDWIGLDWIEASSSYVPIFHHDDQVPWSRLGQEPVVVELDRIFVLAEPSTNVQGSGADSVQEGKVQCVQASVLHA
jgi:hypothetical protein